MAATKTTFGIAMRNFTKYPELPDPQALIDFGVRAEVLPRRDRQVREHARRRPDHPGPV
jgi:alkanesulfonate monooxygenase